MHTARGEAVVACLGRTEREFSERDRDVLDIARPALESALRATQARGRLVRALLDDPPPGSAVTLLDRDGEIEFSSPDARRWLAEHFGTAEHPGWLPPPVAEWLALLPRPPLVSERDGRRLTVCLLPGDPHALLLEETVTSFRQDALDRLGLTARESEVLRAATVIEGEAELALELFLSLHAVRERLERVEAKLGVRTAGDAVARALDESL
jgi:DNA-binding CsgD family transcriptional regulator